MLRSCSSLLYALRTSVLLSVFRWRRSGIVAEANASAVAMPSCRNYGDNGLYHCGLRITNLFIWATVRRNCGVFSADQVHRVFYVFRIRKIRRAACALKLQKRRADQRNLPHGAGRKESRRVAIISYICTESRLPRNTQFLRIIYMPVMDAAIAVWEVNTDTAL